MENKELENIVEAALLAAGEPLSLDRLQALFDEESKPEKKQLREVLDELASACEGRGIELKEVGNGFRYQARMEMADWVNRLWDEKPVRYSRALLETLALVAYRQPITRAEIEDIRGVAVSSHIVKTLLERGWVRVVGHRDVPGRPALYATTREFLDYFDLKSLDELPALAELRDLDKINAELDLRLPGEEGTLVASVAAPDNVGEAEPGGGDDESLSVEGEPTSIEGDISLQQEPSEGGDLIDEHPEDSDADAPEDTTSNAAEGGVSDEDIPDRDTIH